MVRAFAPDSRCKELILTSRFEFHCRTWRPILWMRPMCHIRHRHEKDPSHLNGPISLNLQPFTEKWWHLHTSEIFLRGTLNNKQSIYLLEACPYTRTPDKGALKFILLEETSLLIITINLFHRLYTHEQNRKFSKKKCIFTL